MKNFISEYWALIPAAYEFLVHAIPTKKNYSILEKVGLVLTFVSNLLNRKRKINNLPMLAVVTFSLAFFVSGCAAIKNAAKKVECKSVKYIQVVVTTAENKFYTIDFPYCDTIKLNNISDTTNLK